MFCCIPALTYLAKTQDYTFYFIVSGEISLCIFNRIFTLEQESLPAVVTAFLIIMGMQTQLIYKHFSDYLN